MGAGSSKVPKDVMKTLLSSTTFSSGEIEEWFVVFHQHHPDGQITQQEFVDDNVEAHGGSADLWAYMFSTMDPNNTAHVDFVTFAERVHLASRGTADEKLKLTFNILDIKKDGYVDKDEMTQLFTWLFELREARKMVDELPMEQQEPRARVTAIFGKYDLDADGQLTLEEFNEGCRADNSIMEVMQFVR